MSNKKILFVTTSSLSTNPRLVKEIKYFSSIGCQIKVVAFQLGNWGDQLDDRLKAELNVEVIYLDATRKSILNWLYYSLKNKLSRKMYSNGSTLKQAAYASNKRAIQILHALKKVKDTADFIFAHNLGALYPSYIFSKQTKAKLIFDVEDYHPGENIGEDSKNEIERRERLMKELLPNIHAVTYASPLIKAEVEKLLHKKLDNSQVINNSFFQKEFNSYKGEESQKLRFVWFSQFVSFGRGLEPFLEAADQFSEEIEIELIGELDGQFNEELLKHRKYITTKAPMDQKELHGYIGKFHIGLALELNTADLNRQICLTNKIFAYAQAGLYIFATDTPAQIEFMQRNSQLGILSRQNSKDMELKIEGLLKRKQELILSTEDRFAFAQRLSYDNEQLKYGDLLK